MRIFKPSRAGILTTVVAAVIIGAALKFIFNGDIVLPQYFTVGGLRVYCYGIILALAILAAYVFSRRRSQQFGISLDQLDSIALVLIVSGFIGARLYHVLTDLPYYQANWQAVVHFWNGGLGIYGAIAGGLIGLWCYNKFWLPQFSYLKLLDFLTPSLLIGQIIGRLGNLFNYELFGLPTNAPWKMFVPPVFRTAPYESAQFYHPLFLYESIAGLLILYILVKWVNPKSGQIFWFWLGSYSLVRLFIDLMRAQNNYLFGVPQYAVISIPLILLSLFMLIKSHYESKESQNI